MKIDIHTHLMPEKMPNWTKRFGYGDFIHLEHRNCRACMMKGETFFREVEANCFAAAPRLQDMEKFGVTTQVLSTIPVLFNYWAKPRDGLETARFFNDHIAETVDRDPQHFIGLGTLPMQDIDLAIQEMQRCKHELKLPGIEIGTNINNENLSEKKFFPFYQAAEEAGMALFIHPWEMMGQAQMQRYWLPWLVGMPAETTRAICSLIFGGVFEQFPKLRFAFAHGGGSFPITIGRIQHGFDVRPDLTAIDNDKKPTDYLGHCWFDSLVHDADALQFLIHKAGEDKVCLGTDYPFPLGELSPGALIESMPLKQGIQEKLFYKNALEWLRPGGEEYCDRFRDDEK